MRVATCGCGFAVTLAATLVTAGARATDPFEIQVYDGKANAPGVPGVELHLNSVLEGRKEATEPVLPSHHQTHFTLEPSLGITDWLEVGAYLQTALRGDGHFDWAGAKLRAKLVTPPSPSPFRFGINFELSRLPETYDADRWGGEVRPIAAYETRVVLLALNPNLDLSFAGEGAHHAPSLQPAAMVLGKIREIVSLGLEYYANFGPLGSFLPKSAQEHYLYEVANVLAWKGVELNFGVGEGLGGASDPFVVKAIVGYTWERPEVSPSPLALLRPLSLR